MVFNQEILRVLLAAYVIFPIRPDRKPKAFGSWSGWIGRITSGAQGSWTLPYDRKVSSRNTANEVLPARKSTSVQPKRTTTTNKQTKAKNAMVSDKQNYKTITTTTTTTTTTTNEPLTSACEIPFTYSRSTLLVTKETNY